MLGFAHGPGTLPFLDRNPGVADFVELPFELLRHDPAAASIRNRIPVILHCASMSIAGFVPPAKTTLEEIARAAEEIGTPWIGEHLAFMMADPLPDLRKGAALHDPTTLTYTVCPQLSEEVVDMACRNLADLQSHFSMPLVVENSPQYFPIPGSTMSIVDFVIEVHRRAKVGMLLDLTHFTISSMNMGFDPHQEILRLPLEQLVELHVSGLDVQEGTAWDNHGEVANDTVLELAAAVLERVRPSAITFEYNWAPDLPDSVLLEQMGRIRRVLRHG